MKKAEDLLPHVDVDKDFVDIHFGLFKKKKEKNKKTRFSDSALRLIDFLRHEWLVKT